MKFPVESSPLAWASWAKMMVEMMPNDPKVRKRMSFWLLLLAPLPPAALFG